MRITDLLMHTLLVSNAYVKSTEHRTYDIMLVSEVVVLDKGLKDAACCHTLQTSLSHK